MKEYIPGTRERKQRKTLEKAEELQLAVESDPQLIWEIIDEGNRMNVSVRKIDEKQDRYHDPALYSNASFHVGLSEGKDFSVEPMEVVPRDRVQTDGGEPETVPIDVPVEEVQQQFDLRSSKSVDKVMSNEAVRKIQDDPSQELPMELIIGGVLVAVAVLIGSFVAT